MTNYDELLIRKITSPRLKYQVIDDLNQVADRIMVACGTPAYLAVSELDSTKIERAMLDRFEWNLGNQRLDFSVCCVLMSKDMNLDYVAKYYRGENHSRFYLVDEHLGDVLLDSKQVLTMANSPIALDPNSPHERIRKLRENMIEHVRGCVARVAS